jgi:hypothetical protein
MDYRLNGTGIRVRFPTRTRDFSLLHSVQTISEARPPSTPVGTEDSFCRCRASGLEADHLYLRPRLGTVKLYLRSPKRLYGVMLASRKGKLCPCGFVTIMG